MAKYKITAVLILIGLSYFLSQVFFGRLLLPQFFSLGIFIIRYYGIFMALAVFSGWLLIRKRVKKFSIDLKIADDLIFWIIIGGFFGARLYHVLTSFEYYRYHPAEIFQVWHGGLSIYGAVIGGLTVLFVYKQLSTKHSCLHLPSARADGGQVALSTILDWLTPSLILGQLIGRFGNLFNYEAFGYPTNLPWKMFVPVSFRPAGFMGANFFHPWFLYEQFGLALIFFIISRIESKGRGALFLWYVLLYNTLRFGLEFLRIDSNFILGFRQNAAVSLFLVLLALGAIYFQSKKAKDAQIS